MSKVFSKPFSVVEKKGGVYKQFNPISLSLTEHFPTLECLEMFQPFQLLSNLGELLNPLERATFQGWKAHIFFAVNTLYQNDF
jgi:hypothetical protein